MPQQNLSLPQAYMHALSLQKQGQVNQAAAIYQKIMLSDKNFAPAALQLARLFVASGSITKALETLEHCSHAAHNNFEYLYMLSALRLQAGKVQLALDSATRARGLSPENAHCMNLLGSIYMENNNFDAAIDCFQESMRLDGSFVDPVNNIAWAYRTTGASKDAIAHFAKAYDMDPNATEALSGLLMLKRFEGPAPELQQALNVLKDQKLDIKAKTDLHFALGKAFEDFGDYPQAFAQFNAGNRLWRTNQQYSINEDQQLFAALKSAVYQIDQADAKSKPSGPVPIFVVGMPRSSTSLVEQVLASHSQISGAGELPSLAHALLKGKEFSWDSSRVEALRRDYLGNLKKFAMDKRYVVDKMPHNFRFIGVILEAFPEAKIIHCARDARDNCLSLFKHHFPMTQHPYAYSQSELADYHLLYQDLMLHWHDLAGSRILTLQYEEMIDDFETHVRQMLSFIGVPFESDCLDFQKTRRAIRTASSEQVRRGLYKSGAGQWQNYENELAELFRGLEKS